MCLRLVDEACRLPFEEICVTGGEPYLRRALIYKLAGLARSRGRLFGSISNGFWAKDRGRAFELANEMIANGVARVTFSWDPSHGKFIPPATIQNGIDACVEAGMKVTLTGSFKELGDTHEKHGIKTGHLDMYDTFSVVDSYVAPAGWGKSLTEVYRAPVSPNSAASFRCPGGISRELVCYAQDGLVQPCCSVHAGYDMPNLRVGDWRTQSVGDLWLAQNGDPFFRVISDVGFGLLYSLIEERDPAVYGRLPKPEQAHSACHLCEQLMTSSDAHDIRRICDDFVREKLTSWVYENSETLSRALPQSLA